MKLASITLPFSDIVADSIRLDRGHQEIRQTLRLKYRGYTRLTAKGAWRDDSGKLFYEDVYRYEFAVDDERDYDTAEDLQALAFRVKVLTDEQLIMVVHASGIVEFI